MRIQHCVKMCFFFQCTFNPSVQTRVIYIQCICTQPWGNLRSYFKLLYWIFGLQCITHPSSPATEWMFSFGVTVVIVLCKLLFKSIESIVIMLLHMWTLNFCLLHSCNRQSFTIQLENNITDEYSVCGIYV